MKNTLLLLLVLLASSIAAQEMTVDDAIRIGLMNNYDIQIARNQAAVADNNTGLGTAGFLPTVQASGNYDLTDTDEESNSANSTGDSETENLGAVVSFNWTLFDGFKMFADRARYNELAKLGEYQARNTIENTVVGIARAYYDLVQQEQLLDVAKNSRDISRTRLEKEQVRNDLGGASSTDLLNARVAYNNDQSTLLNQELAVIVAREDLNVALGRDPATPVTVSKNIPVPSRAMQYDEILDLAKQHNAALRVARQDKLVADNQVQAGKSPFLPKLALTGSYGYTDRTVTPNSIAPLDITTETNNATIGLSLSMNLFNGSRDRIALQNAKLEAENKQLALRDAENQLAGDVRKAYDTFNKRVELVRLEEENVEAAAQSLDLQQDRYRLGATSSLEFRDAQVSLARARNSLIVARYLAVIAHLEIDQLTGTIEID